MPGPLEGIRIIELSGIGPGPFACMMLADHGAQVIRVERPGAPVLTAEDVLGRSREVVVADLKTEEGKCILRDLASSADGLIEGYRPGVMERLGLGPDTLCLANPRLVYGRITGWGQTGPYAQAAGHDLNYISLPGVAHSIGRRGEKPVPPLALVGDFGGGGMLMAFSMTAALLHAHKTGHGQVIDCAMIEGAGLLMSAFYELRAKGQWRDEREVNLLDGGAPFYDFYETSDGKFVSIAPIEPQFYGLFLEKLGISGEALFASQMDDAVWFKQKERIAAIIVRKTRDEWCDLLEGTDVCFAPVLNMAEAPGHKQAVARGSFVSLAGITHPTPAPRYSVTKLGPPRISSNIDTANSGRPKWPGRQPT